MYICNYLLSINNHYEGVSLDYEELVEINNKFPQLFAPAFRLQQQLMAGYMVHGIPFFITINLL